MRVRFNLQRLVMKSLVDMQSEGPLAEDETSLQSEDFLCERLLTRETLPLFPTPRKSNIVSVFDSTRATDRS